MADLSSTRDLTELLRSYTSDETSCLLNNVINLYIFDFLGKPGNLARVEPSTLVES